MARRTSDEQSRAGFRRRARPARAHELRLDPAAVDTLLDLTEDPDAQVRNEAVRSLCPCHVQANIERVWDRLLAMVTDPDTKVRATVLHTLCDGSPRLREAEVVQVLEQMHNDTDPQLRRRIRHLLASYRRTGKINIL